MEILNSQKNHPHKQQEQQEDLIKKEQEEEEEEEMRGRYFHVLAVDDSRIERKILEQLLTVSSYQVTSVESGDKALEYLGLLDSSQQQGDGMMKVNLIMTDYSMPGMTGYDLLKKVKGSSWKDVPVIVMSSENVPSRIHMCLEEGAEEFLLKPVRMSDLKKLQPYITRSLRHCYCTNTEGDDTKVEIHLIEGNTDNTKVEIRLIEENSDDKKVEIRLTEENAVDRLNLEEKLVAGDSDKQDSDEQEETNKEINPKPERRSTNDKVSIQGLKVV